MLAEANTNEWKDAIINKALMLNAYGILMGTETLDKTDEAAAANFTARQSRLAGNIGSTLNEAIRALLRNANPKIDPIDAHSTWKFIVNHLESKSTNSRLFAAQEMIALRKGDTGHENETYSAYGACCIRQGNTFKNLLPAGATCTGDNALLAKITFDEGFTARDLVDELTVSMIIVGLGFEEKDRRLQSTLTHIGVGSLTRILEELRNTDTLIRASALAEATSSSVNALAARKKPATTSKSLFECIVHGKNATHDTKECKVVKSALENAKNTKPKKEKKAKKADDGDDDTDEEAETPSMVQAAKLASPPRHRRVGACTDTTCTADLGATTHMTPHKEWIRDMEPCRVPVRLANDDVVWATGRGNIIFSPLIDGKATQFVEFNRVLYVPDLESNLFSVLAAVRRGKLKVIIEKDVISFLKDGILLFTWSVYRNIGTLNGTTLDCSEQVFFTRITRSLLHQRLGHIGKDRLERLLKEDLADGVIIDPKSELRDICDHCITGKQHCEPFPHASEHRSTILLGVTIPRAYAPAATDRAFWIGLDWSRMSGTLGAPTFLSDRPSMRYM